MSHTFDMVVMVATRRAEQSTQGFSRLTKKQVDVELIFL